MLVVQNVQRNLGARKQQLPTAHCTHRSASSYLCLRNTQRCIARPKPEISPPYTSPQAGI
eukprot:5611412-Karenia_brevis.AAC.1